MKPISMTLWYLLSIVVVLGMMLTALVLVDVYRPDKDNLPVIMQIVTSSGIITAVLINLLRNSAVAQAQTNAIAETKQAVQENTELTAAGQVRNAIKAEAIKAEVQSVKEIVQGKP